MAKSSSEEKAKVAQKIISLVLDGQRVNGVSQVKMGNDMQRVTILPDEATVLGVIGNTVTLGTLRRYAAGSREEAPTKHWWEFWK